MIWFNLDLARATPIRNALLDDNLELTQKILSMLGANNSWVLLTSSHEISENDIVLEDNVWEMYDRWEEELLNAGHHAQTEVFNHYNLTLITTTDGNEILQIVDHDFPAVYVTKQL